jgi:putative transposase
MPHYRRSSLLTDRVLDLRYTVRRVRAVAAFGIDAWVVLPDHIHAVWTLPEGDSDFPRRWRAIKDLFSRRIDPRETLSASRSFQDERGIWQRRYWSTRSATTHLNYVHFNPVKHGYVSYPIDWPYSSFRACVEKGLYPPDRLGSDECGADRGERPPAVRRGTL